MAARPQQPSRSFWQRAGSGSKSGFDKLWGWADKAGAPVNRLSNKLGSESFWPTTLDKESEKAARILRSFCKDGFYHEELCEASGDGPKQKQKVVKKIPEKVIQKAKGLAIFTTMRTGLWVSGAGGSGIVVARKEDGTWGQPIGIMLHTAGLGFLVGVDIYDCVLVLNTTQAVEAFSKWRATLGGEISVAAGPVGAGGVLDTELHQRQSPIFSYLKSRGFYAGVQIDGTVVIERTDENERFYGQKLPAMDILMGKAQSRQSELEMLMETLKAAQGDKEFRLSLLPQGAPPADHEVVESDHQFGVPDKEDPDPYGVLALENAGMVIKEAGTKVRASVEQFEFNPKPTSPVFRSSFEGSSSQRSGRSSWRESRVDRPYRTSEIGVQTDFDLPASPTKRASGPPPPLPPRQSMRQSLVSSLSSPPLPPREMPRDSTMTLSPPVITEEPSDLGITMVDNEDCSTPTVGFNEHKLSADRLSHPVEGFTQTTPMISDRSRFGAEQPLRSDTPPDTQTSISPVVESTISSVNEPEIQLQSQSQNPTPAQSQTELEAKTGIDQKLTPEIKTAETIRETPEVKPETVEKKMVARGIKARMAAFESQNERVTTNEKDKKLDIPEVKQEVPSAPSASPPLPKQPSPDGSKAQVSAVLASDVASAYDGSSSPKESGSKFVAPGRNDKDNKNAEQSEAGQPKNDKEGLSQDTANVDASILASKHIDSVSAAAPVQQVDDDKHKADDKPEDNEDGEFGAEEEEDDDDMDEPVVFHEVSEARAPQAIQARVVSVPKRVTPQLPSRNPQRMRSALSVSSNQRSNASSPHSIAPSTLDGRTSVEARRRSSQTSNPPFSEQIAADQSMHRVTSHESKIIDVNGTMDNDKPLGAINGSMNIDEPDIPGGFPASETPAATESPHNPVAISAKPLITQVAVDLAAQANEARSSDRRSPSRGRPRTRVLSPSTNGASMSPRSDGSTYSDADIVTATLAEQPKPVPKIQNRISMAQIRGGLHDYNDDDDESRSPSVTRKM